MAELQDCIGEGGALTDGFVAAARTAAGEGHEESKAFDDIPNLSALVKSYADTKSAYSKKLESTFLRPADDASDVDKAAYRDKLSTELGAPGDAKDYEFFKAEKLPEGMERSQDLEDKFRAVLFEHKASKTLVKALSQVFEEVSIESFNGMIENDKAETAKKTDAENQAFEDGCTKLRADNPGDKLPVFCRTALAAINKFGDADLIAKLKEADMYTNATDLAKWREVGVPLNTLQLFGNIGAATIDAKVLGGGGGGGGTTITEKAQKMYPNTKG